MAKIFLKNKKGNIVVGVIIIFFTIFTVAIATLSMQQPFKELADEIIKDPEMSQESKDIVNQQQQNYQNSWDGMIVFIFAMLWLFGIVSSFFIDSHPFFFILALIMLFIGFGVLATLGNEFLEFTADENINSYAVTDYPYTLWIMGHSLELGILMAFSMMVALYAKFRGEGI